MENQAKESVGGDGRRMTVTLLLAVASLLLFFALVFEDFGQFVASDWSQLPIGLITRYAISMGLAGAVVGYLLSGMFGKRGLIGWIVAVIGGLVVSTLSGLLGSTIGLAPDLLSDGLQTTDFVAIGAGALVLPLAAIGWPFLLPLWLVLVVSAHLVARKGQ